MCHPAAGYRLTGDQVGACMGVGHRNAATREAERDLGPQVGTAPAPERASSRVQMGVDGWVLCGRLRWLWVSGQVWVLCGQCGRV